MREIEIKASVQDPKKIILALKKQGVLLGDPVKQRDVVYAKPNAIDGDRNENWLRIRTEDDHRSIFTLKRQVTNELDSIEHETEISDPHELTKIIEYLGFTLYSDLTKVRQKARIGDVEICLDNVEGLGIFIEAELLIADDEDSRGVHERLWKVLESLGVTRQHSVLHGYDVLMRKKHGPPEPIRDKIEWTLLFLIQNNQILLGYKKRGFSGGKLSGVGGKVAPGETAEQAAVRESQEKIGVTPTYFSKVADFDFDEWYKGRRERIHTQVFVCEEWTGDPLESDEMRPEWHACDNLPFTQMWQDYSYWLPQVTAGDRVKGTFEYDQDNTLLAHSVTLVEDA
jgi:predicted adenylyl cyclase CyaB